MGTIFVDKLDPQSGTSLTLGSSGDTVFLTSGAKTSGFGKVGQIVQGTTNSVVNTTSTSYVDTGLDVNITPTTTSSKVLVFATFQGQTTANTVFSLFRDSTNLLGDLGFCRLEDALKQRAFSMQFLDSPSSSSQLNYEIRFKSYGSATSTFSPQTECTAMIQALEILD